MKETLTEIRKMFWVVRGRSLVKSIVRQCRSTRGHHSAVHHLHLCRRSDSKKTQHSHIQALTLLALSLCAMDLPTIAVRYGFVCIHAWLPVPSIWIDLSTETFLWCLKRFTARRGLPRKFLSDNGSTFKAAAKVLSLIFKDPTVQEYLADVGSQWIFNIERAPWWGGVFERMVKSTKTLKLTLVN